MSELFNKTKKVFADLATDKRVANKQEFFMLPRYVVEYLASKFTDKYGEENYGPQLSKFIAKYYHEARERDKVLSDVMTTGKITLIDEVKVTTDVELGTYRAHLQNLNISNQTRKTKPVTNKLIRPAQIRRPPHIQIHPTRLKPLQTPQPITPQQLTIPRPTQHPTTPHSLNPIQTQRHKTPTTPSVN